MSLFRHFMFRVLLWLGGVGSGVLASHCRVRLEARCGCFLLVVIGRIFILSDGTSGWTDILGYPVADFYSFVLSMPVCGEVHFCGLLLVSKGFGLADIQWYLAVSVFLSFMVRGRVVAWFAME